MFAVYVADSVELICLLNVIVVYLFDFILIFFSVCMIRFVDLIQIRD